MDSRERRQQRREAAPVRALVSDRTDSIEMKCVMREVSEGACRITSSNIGDLPRVVKILPEGFEAPVTGKIIWRNKKFAGVQFISEAEATELERAKRVRKQQPDAAGLPSAG